VFVLDRSQRARVQKSPRIVAVVVAFALLVTGLEARQAVEAEGISADIGAAEVPPVQKVVSRPDVVSAVVSARSQRCGRWCLCICSGRHRSPGGVASTIQATGAEHRRDHGDLRRGPAGGGPDAGRATVHRTLAADVTTTIATNLATALVAPVAARDQAGPQRLACPGCGSVPTGKTAAARLREELQTDWWSTSSTDPTRIEVTRHCGRCQPHSVYAVACLACGDGPLLTGALAELARNTQPQQLPDLVTSELTHTGWRWTTTPHASGWVCCQPAVHTAAASTAGGMR
jgi:hypothetical protein